MGRHSTSGAAAGSSPQRAELLGWGLFTLALTVGVLAWLGVGWFVVAGVGAALVLGIGVVWLATASGTGRGPAGGRHDPPTTGAVDDSARH